MPVNDAGSTGGASSPDRLDRTLDALAHRQRRRALYHLRDADGAVTVDALADAVADHADADRDRVRASLYHRHLPKLVDVGLVAHDDRAGHVRYVGDDLAAAWLDRLAAVEK